MFQMSVLSAPPSLCITTNTDAERETEKERERETEAGIEEEIEN